MSHRYGSLSNTIELYWEWYALPMKYLEFSNISTWQAINVLVRVHPLQLRLFTPSTGCFVEWHQAQDVRRRPYSYLLVILSSHFV